MRLLIFSMVLVVSSASCTSARPDCEFVSWTGSNSHMTIGLEEPFTVRTIRGKLIPAFSPDWAENGQALVLVLEIQGNALPQTTVAIKPDGTFNHPVPEGTYCFRVSSEHFQGYAGTIIVSRSAAPESEIELRIDMGA